MTIDQLIQKVFNHFQMILNDYFIETIAPFIDDSFTYGDIVSHMKNNPLYKNVTGAGVFIQYQPANKNYREWNANIAANKAKEIVGDKGVVDSMTLENIVKYGCPTKNGDHYQKDMLRKMVSNCFVPAVQYPAGGIKNMLDPLVKKEGSGWKRPRRGIFQYRPDEIQKKETAETTQKRDPTLRKQFLDYLHERQNGICTGCLNWYKKKDMHIDHILAYSENGTNSIDNLQLLCANCNSKKGNRGMEETFPGWFGKFIKKLVKMEMEELTKSGEYITKEKHAKILLKVTGAIGDE